MPKRLRPQLTFANVVSCLALFVALGGSAYAVKQLPKKSVGTPQLKRGAVTKQKVRKNAIDGRRVKNNSLTGADIKLSKLGTVPSARNAAAAGTANTANVANTANTANAANVANTASVANSLTPPEGWHEIGAPGEPPFLNGWGNYESSFENAAYYKDHEGIVHLKGYITGGTDVFAFELPTGYRPAASKILQFPIACSLGTCASGTGGAAIYGPDTLPEAEKRVAVSGEFASLNGISFRAES